MSDGSKPLPPRPRKYIKQDALFLPRSDVTTLLQCLFDHEQDAIIGFDARNLRLKVVGAMEANREVVITPEAAKEDHKPPF